MTAPNGNGRPSQSAELRRPADRGGRGRRVADRARDRSRPREAVARRGRVHQRGAGAPRLDAVRGRGRRGRRRRRLERPQRRRRRLTTRDGRGGARALPRADRRRGAGVRRGQAAARLLRAPRRPGLAGARARLRARPRRATCSCSPTASAATSRSPRPPTHRRSSTARRRRSAPSAASAPTPSPPTRCSAATRSSRWSPPRAPRPPARSCSCARPTRARRTSSTPSSRPANACGSGSRRSSTSWGSRARRGSQDVGAVTGATEPEHLARLRELMPHDAVPAARDRRPGRRRRGARAGVRPGHAPAGLVTASRSIANAHSAPAVHPPEAARAEAERLRRQAWDLG